MKKLETLIQGIGESVIIGNTNRDISELFFDSRLVTPDSLFVAIRGNTEDGSVFIHDAIMRGSKVVIHDTVLRETKSDITYIMVKDSRIALAHIAENFYGNPSSKIALVGVTGTNGKTTTATLLFELFIKLGYHSALISTIENKIGDEIFPTTHTTPDPITLSLFLSEAVNKGCSHVFMECSSHAIDQKRIHGLTFKGGIFTNLTHDHLDYHKTLEEYAKAKKSFFDFLPQESFALANHDDSQSEYMLECTRAHKHFFSLNENSLLQKDSRFSGKIINQSLEGCTLEVGGVTLHTKLLGDFNAYNIVGIYATALLLGVSEQKIIPAIAELTSPKGRLEFLRSNRGICGIVDYAHTPDALYNVLSTLHKILPAHGKIITVVGCGGDRDKSKRGVMGNIATKLSDYVFFTADNPRTENPQAILDEITHNISGKNFECIVDRANAITRACAHASTEDIVLIAGKGHEQYQIFPDKTIYFSDQEEFKKT